MNGLIPRVEVEKPGCCSTAEEGRTEKSRRVWRDVGVRVCGVGRPGPGQDRAGQSGTGGGPQAARAVVLQERGSAEEEGRGQRAENREQRARARFAEDQDQDQEQALICKLHLKPFWHWRARGCRAHRLPGPAGPAGTHACLLASESPKDASSTHCSRPGQGCSDLWRTANTTPELSNADTSVSASALDLLLSDQTSEPAAHCPLPAPRGWDKLTTAGGSLRAWELSDTRALLGRLDLLLHLQRASTSP
ncbi:hypothetical protein N431DRAFT_506036 [Stipitochalara longipes BDJ]|nr:hypothetical protein N431DRAFT_506036 [Stipitochalara longipes BDJ]